MQACRKVREGRLASAACMLERAWEVDSSQLDIAPDLAGLYVQLRDFRSARRALDHAVELSVRQPTELSQALAQRGHFFLATGHFSLASRDLRMAVRLDPSNKRIQPELQQADRQVYLATVSSAKARPARSR